MLSWLPHEYCCVITNALTFMAVNVIELIPFPLTITTMNFSV